ncbi:MAG: hypothetical protein NDJ75_03925 [Thermoanaerobaculia bacterium]|nr:hypothetical protein [Thermoanaerobaculia bacterium]
MTLLVAPLPSPGTMTERTSPQAADINAKSQSKNPPLRPPSSVRVLAVIVPPSQPSPRPGIAVPVAGSIAIAVLTAATTSHRRICRISSSDHEEIRFAGRPARGPLYLSRASKRTFFDIALRLRHRNGVLPPFVKKVGGAGSR